MFAALAMMLATASASADFDLSALKANVVAHVTEKVVKKIMEPPKIEITSEMIAEHQERSLKLVEGSQPLPVTTDSAAFHIVTKIYNDSNMCYNDISGTMMEGTAALAHDMVMYRSCSFAGNSGGSNIYMSPVGCHMDNGNMNVQYAYYYNEHCDGPPFYGSSGVLTGFSSSCSPDIDTVWSKTMCMPGFPRPFNGAHSMVSESYSTTKDCKAREHHVGLFHHFADKCLKGMKGNSCQNAEVSVSFYENDYCSGAPVHTEVKKLSKKKNKKTCKKSDHHRDSCNWADTSYGPTIPPPAH